MYNFKRVKKSFDTLTKKNKYLHITQVAGWARIQFELSEMPLEFWNNMALTDNPHASAEVHLKFKNTSFISQKKLVFAHIDIIIACVHLTIFCKKYV